MRSLKKWNSRTTQRTTQAKKRKVTILTTTTPSKKAKESETYGENCRQQNVAGKSKEARKRATEETKHDDGQKLVKTIVNTF